MAASWGCEARLRVPGARLALQPACDWLKSLAALHAASHDVRLRIGRHGKRQGSKFYAVIDRQLGRSKLFPDIGQCRRAQIADRGGVFTQEAREAVFAMRLPKSEQIVAPSIPNRQIALLVERYASPLDCVDFTERVDGDLPRLVEARDEPCGGRPAGLGEDAGVADRMADL